MSERRPGTPRGEGPVGAVSPGIPRRGAAVGLLALVGALMAAGCGPVAPTATVLPTPSPAITATPEPTSGPSSTSAPSADAPAGTAYVNVPAAGILLPVPESWVSVPAADLLDPARRAELAERFPGAGELLAETAELDGWATPVFLAADPSEAARSGPLAANLSVLATQPAVGGPLLDLAAGFIADGLAESLGATTPPGRERVELPVGEAIRLDLDVPSMGGEEIRATAWVIGAPSATLLVTLMGPASALGDLDAGSLAEAILPAPAP